MGGKVVEAVECCPNTSSSKWIIGFGWRHCSGGAYRPIAIVQQLAYLATAL